MSRLHDEDTPCPMVENRKEGKILILDADRARSARMGKELSSVGWRTACPEDISYKSLLSKNGFYNGVDIIILHDDDVSPIPADLLERIRSDAGDVYIPIVILTRRHDDKRYCRYLEMGADDVLPEGALVSLLDARLQALLRVKVYLDELRLTKRSLDASLRQERAVLNQLRRDNAHLLTLSTTDPLTHLQNVRYFDSFLEKAFKIARRYNRSLSLLTLDLDHFKMVNDDYGHPSGDYILKELAVILKRGVRESDVVARIGGEEFSIILPDAGREQARRFAQRIRHAVKRRKFVVLGKTIHVTISVGSATYPADAEVTSPNMLVYLADQALLRAKRLGRDRYVAFGNLDQKMRYELCSQFRSSKHDKFIPFPALSRSR